MSTRRDFLKTVATSLVATGGIGLLDACAAGFANYRGQVDRDQIRIPKQDALSLTQPNGVMMVRAEGLRGAIVLRNTGKEILAVSAVCTHRGCEVRPMPDSLQCPCHGSEYDIDGEVLEGPAREPLRKFEVEEREDAFVVKVSK